MISSRAVEAIEASDSDELLRVIDGLCKARAWDELQALRSRCREAVGRGKQLWGVAEHIRYRLALESTPEIAGEVVSEGATRFGLGPLPEVAASTHSWEELSPHIAQGPTRATTAAERVVRGDTVTAESLELPGIQQWEPRYMVARYKADRIEAPAPKVPELRKVSLPDEVEKIRDPMSESALADLVSPWVEESNGRCETTTVAGGAEHAIRGLGLTTARCGDMSPQLAVAWLGWAAASGGAHGRRRGAAAGRFLAWWAIASLADLDWPAAGIDVGSAAERFEWAWFDDGSPDIGWALRVVVSDPTDGISWAVAAVDLD